MSAATAPDGWMIELAQTTLVMITKEGRVYLPDEQSGELTESYDWARLGRLVYEAVTNGRTPPDRCPTCEQLPCRGWWTLAGEGPKRCQPAARAEWMP